MRLRTTKVLVQLHPRRERGILNKEADSYCATGPKKHILQHNSDLLDFCSHKRMHGRQSPMTFKVKQTLKNEYSF